MRKMVIVRGTCFRRFEGWVLQYLRGAGRAGSCDGEGHGEGIGRFICQVQHVRQQRRILSHGPIMIMMRKVGCV